MTTTAIKKVVRQTTLLGSSESSPESRAVLHACMLNSIPCEIVSFEDLQSHSEDLKTGRVLPVGSVEYVRSAMKVAGFAEPTNMSYPPSLDQFLYRDVRKSTAGLVLGTWFVKPVATKAFTGFVFDTMQDPATLSEHDLEQYNGFMAMDAGDEVWISEIVTWLSEVRYYVLNGKIVGEARYDPDGADDAPLPDLQAVEQAVAALVAVEGEGLTCAIDMGVLSTGETALTEVNDAWAVGRYGNAISPSVYLETR